MCRKEESFDAVDSSVWSIEVGVSQIPLGLYETLYRVLYNKFEAALKVFKMAVASQGKGGCLLRTVA